MGKKSKVTVSDKKKTPGTKTGGVKKAKTKTVTTNLKKLNFHNKAKTANIDKEFGDIQTMVISGKGKTQTPSQKKDGAKRQKSVDQPADVDSAMDSMENLTMPDS